MKICKYRIYKEVTAGVLGIAIAISISTDNTVIAQQKRIQSLVSSLFLLPNTCTTV